MCKYLIKSQFIYKNLVYGRFVRKFSLSSCLENDNKIQPLSGIRVLDLSRVLAGPYSTQILGDLGAEVIKVEHPIRGDDTRAWGPPFAKYVENKNIKDNNQVGESAYYLAANRNKKSIGVNFKSSEGVKIIKKLLEKCDILVENYLPGSLSKYGLSYNDLKKEFPKLIYASITGYGQYGPYSFRPGYDVMVEAEFGLMHITGEKNGPPVKVGVAVTDLTTGLYAANAILASLIYRSKTNRGQHLDISLSDCQLATLANVASSVLISGKKDSGRQGNCHPSICPYQSFNTLDGDIMIGGGNDRLFNIMCDVMNKEEWKIDKRFISNSLRVKNREILIPLIENETKKRTTKEWIVLFKKSGLPHAPINDVKTSLEDEHSVARNMVVTVNHPACGDIKLVNHPVKYSDSIVDIRSPPPMLGEHTTEILSEYGYSIDEISHMRDNGVVG